MTFHISSSIIISQNYIIQLNKSDACTIGLFICVNLLLHLLLFLIWWYSEMPAWYITICNHKYHLWSINQPICQPVNQYLCHKLTNEFADSRNSVSEPNHVSISRQQLKSSFAYISSSVAIVKLWWENNNDLQISCWIQKWKNFKSANIWQDYKRKISLVFRFTV